MAITGNYLAQNSYTGADKWGTGINAVHSLIYNAGRSDDEPHTAQGPGGESSNSIPGEMIDVAEPEYGYTDEEFTNSYIWGYGTQTGTEDRPARDVEINQFRNQMPPKWPGAPGDEGGPPAGDLIRNDDHGAITGDNAKLGYKEETVSEGWRNKQVGGIIDAQDSDVSQLYMQTSQVQRDKVREGSQASGRASEYMAPIGSWRPTWGVRVKPWSGGRRHYDMTPKRQDQYFRAFWYRQPGTGIVEQMEPNEAFNYQHEPMQRQPVQDPYAGTEVPRSGSVYDEESSNVSSWVNVWY